jgi:hypothetical protein
MSYRDPKADRQLADALREMRAADRSSARDQHLLARRIIRHADPLLRTRRRAVAWWEYAATWSRALVPLGLSAATLAAVGMIWLIPPRQPAGARAESSGEHAVLLGAVANRIPPHELLDLLVAPVVVDGRAVTPAERSGEGR